MEELNFERKIVLSVEETPEGSGQRLDKFLSENLPDYSRSYLQKLIKDEYVLVNDKQVTKSYDLKKEDIITVLIPGSRELELKPVEMNLDIIYEDEYLIVVNKPPHLVVHPDKHHQEQTLVHGLLAYFEKLPEINGVYRPGIVHRLDKNTSGVLVVARTKKSLQHLLRQFKERQTKKIYRAVVKRVVPHNKGKISAPIGRDPNNRTRMAVRKENSRRAVTHFEVLKRYREYTYLQLKLETGRTHQIRVHLEYMGYPVVGDKKYRGKFSKTDVNHDLKNLSSRGRHLLHAYKLGFKHPITEKDLEFTAPVPEDINCFLEHIAK